MDLHPWRLHGMQRDFIARNQGRTGSKGHCQAKYIKRKIVLLIILYINKNLKFQLICHHFILFNFVHLTTWKIG